jgi:hypothetical protein
MFNGLLKFPPLYLCEFPEEADFFRTEMSCPRCEQLISVFFRKKEYQAMVQASLKHSHPLMQ